jgi:predicted nucleic acid-binding protein
MRLYFDTTVLVDIERRRPDAIAFLKHAQAGNHELWISTVTVSEIFTGCNLRRDAEAAVNRAREVLSQFLWHDLDGEVAVRIGQLAAFLRSHGRPIPYPDVAIAATALVLGPDLIVTDNTKDFASVPQLAKIVATPKEAARRIGRVR